MNYLCKRSFKLWILFFGVLLIIYLFITSSPRTISHLPINEQCIDSFDTFAFTFPNPDSPTQSVVLPISPWMHIAKLPDFTENKKFDVVAIRSATDYHEIWIADNTSVKVGNSFWVYNTSEQDWLEIPKKIENDVRLVENIFVLNDNSIWGVSILNTSTNTMPNQIVFSVYSESLRRFVTKTIQEFPNLESNRIFDDNNFSTSSEVLLAPDNLFWILVAHDAIYSFDTSTLQIKMHISLANYGDTQQLRYAPDNTLYFVSFLEGKSVVFQFSPITNEMIPVDIPYGSFFSVSLVDHNGKLWLNDAYAWKELGENWHILHPNPLEYWWYQEIAAGWKYYSPPDPFMESSDGRIWFRIDRSNNWKNLRSGIAWFSPKTNEGCWFTTESAQIVEDSQSNLWMIVNGELYTYNMYK